MKQVIDQITETVTAPQVGLPLTAGPGSLLFMGVPLPDWLTIFSVIYVIILVAHKLWSWYKEWKNNDKT